MRFLLHTVAEGQGDLHRVALEPHQVTQLTTILDTLKQDQRGFRYVCDLMGLPNVRMGKGITAPIPSVRSQPKSGIPGWQRGEPIYVNFHLGLGRRTFDMGEVFATLTPTNRRTAPALWQGSAGGLRPTWPTGGRSIGPSGAGHPQLQQLARPLTLRRYTTLQEPTRLTAGAAVIFRLWKFLRTWSHEAAAQGRLAVRRSYHLLGQTCGLLPDGSLVGDEAARETGLGVQIGTLHGTTTRAPNGRWLSHTNQPNPE